jgi:hypothetical protein
MLTILQANALSFYQADWLDVDFEPASQPEYASEFQWQILCTSTDYQVIQ